MIKTKFKWVILFALGFFISTALFGLYLITTNGYFLKIASAQNCSTWNISIRDNLSKESIQNITTVTRGSKQFDKTFILSADRARWYEMYASVAMVQGCARYGFRVSYSEINEKGDTLQAKGLSTTQGFSSSIRGSLLGIQGFTAGKLYRVDINAIKAAFDDRAGDPSYNDYRHICVVAKAGDLCSAQSGSSTNTQPGSSTGSSTEKKPLDYKLPEVGYFGKVSEFMNPLESETVSGLIAQAIRIMLILVGASAVVVIAISGFQLVISSGNPEKRASAIRSITWAIIGLILAILSFSIVAIVQRIIS